LEVTLCDGGDNTLYNLGIGEWCSLDWDFRKRYENLEVFTATNVSGTIVTQRNSGVQALRAIAALFVVVQHAVYWASLSAGVDRPIFMYWGDIGVSTFFVISGYVMLMCLPQGRMFMVWRVARIYPGFWAAVLLSAAIYSLTGSFWQLDWYSLSLLPTQHMNGVYGIPYWTLIYELVFYAIMYIVAYFQMTKKSAFWLLFLWFLLIILANVLHIDVIYSLNWTSPGLWIVVSPANLMFIAGALYGLIGQRWLQKLPVAAISLVGLSLFVFVSGLVRVNLSLFNFYLISGLTYVLILDLAIRIDAPKWLTYGGDASYGLYLTHFIFIIACITITTSLLPNSTFWTYFLVCICSGVVGGLGYGLVEHYLYTTVTKPSLKKLEAVLRHA